MKAYIDPFIDKIIRANIQSADTGADRVNHCCEVSLKNR